MAELEFLVPEDVPAPRATYSHAVRISSGTHIAMAGQVPIDERGRTVGLGDIEAQTRQVLQKPVRPKGGFRAFRSARRSEAPPMPRTSKESCAQPERLSPMS